jgi:hypothetical protein
MEAPMLMGFHAIHADPLGAVCIIAPAKPTLPSSSIGYPPAVLLVSHIGGHTDVRSTRHAGRSGSQQGGSRAARSALVCVQAMLANQEDADVR